MNSFCCECGEWASGRVDLEGDRGCFRCEACGHQTERVVFPLLVVTGARGAGKTTIIGPVRQRLHGCAVVFDKNAMRATDRAHAYNNYFGVASSLAQSGIPSVVVGTVAREDLDDLTERDLVGEILYLNLHCSDAERERRLRSRPDWRWSSHPELIEQQRGFALRLLQDIPATVETDRVGVAETADAVAAWVRSNVGRLTPLA